ncbi:uncharacterized protein LOC136078033 isoform X2 [Hydra vulgaris]|uniref:Uncharacterized protein LOC136078033 isoform X2 n=1 Tax=Hydra vulgaris TaxID=6087 RepID=A0ABM4BI99_HYDVU
MKSKCNSHFLIMPLFKTALSLEEAQSFIKNHELEYTVRFSTSFSTKGFGNTDPKEKNHKVYWSTDSIAFSGLPFMLIGTKILHCHHGHDRNINLKEFNKQKKQAILKVDTVRNRKVKSKELRHALSLANKEINQIRKFCIVLPDILSHSGHIIAKDSGISQSIDPELVTAIDLYVKEGVLSTKEMKRLLNIQVKNNFNKTGSVLPEISNKRFFPRNSTIHNHIAISRRKLCQSLIDQESLQLKINEWREADPAVHIYFRPKGHSTEDINIESDYEDNTVRLTGTKETSLLFVYQNAWQKRLLAKYGNELVLLDATYRTTRYALPLFFFVVKTNIDYQVVGLFVCENETEESISEALSFLKSWNNDLNPKYGMSDYCVEEINSLEKVFEGCVVFICDFHREQAWDRWLKTKCNGLMEDRQKIMGLLRIIAHADTYEICESAIENLKISSYWTNHEALRNYISRYWLAIKHRWVTAYRHNRLLVNCNTNNGVERQHKTLKHKYLSNHRYSSLTRMLTVVVEDFLCDKYESYIESNQLMSSKYMRYAADIDFWMLDRPRPMVKHCLVKKSLAESIDITGIQVEGCGKFSLRYYKDNSERNYIIDFGDESKMPSCTCIDWKRSCYPCKHFFVVFKKYPCWNWESISPLYRMSPYLNLDIGFEFDKANTKGPNDKLSTTTYASDISNNEHKESSIDRNENSEVLVKPDAQNGRNTGKQSITSKSIRSLLSELQSLSFLIEHDESLLGNTYKELSNIIENVKNAIPKESCLPLLPNNDKTSHMQNSCVKYHKLPAPKRKNTKFKRVGEKKEKLLAASKIEVTFKPEKKHVETEVINNNLLDYENLLEFKDECIVCSDDEYTGSDENTNTDKKNSKISLCQNDLSDISNNGWLSDNVINMFQNMMKIQFKDINGLQDTILGQTLAFNTYNNIPFVQVLHDGHSHWVAISTYRCKPGEVFLMDSLFHGKVAHHTKRQICAILKCMHNKLTIRVLPVQQQSNGADCGVFAISFIYHIISTKTNPDNITFSIPEMRAHMLQCIQVNKVSSFPQLLADCKRCIQKDICIELFCSCRMPWNPAENKLKEKQMAQCNRCQQWFHKMCENIPDFVFSKKNRRTPWYCYCCGQAV